ncbi:hypothetical protein RRG08_066506 [Elysia crispata]|uniref:Uncharacterized protein n=1 Tax=Elysia crispata TaxID=231223 RepID=A0AAE1CZW1_9GAST|nr:hypothetical protein RRG08_066506 [Elysia crispata]
MGVMVILLCVYTVRPRRLTSMTKSSSHQTQSLLVRLKTILENRRVVVIANCAKPFLGRAKRIVVQSLEDEAPTKPINVIGIEITKDIPDLVKANNLAPHPLALIKARTDGARPKGVYLDEGVIFDYKLFGAVVLPVCYKVISGSPYLSQRPKCSWAGLERSGLHTHLSGRDWRDQASTPIYRGGTGEIRPPHPSIGAGLERSGLHTHLSGRDWRDQASTPIYRGGTGEIRPPHPSIGAGLERSGLHTHLSGRDWRDQASTPIYRGGTGEIRPPHPSIGAGLERSGLHTHLSGRDWRDQASTPIYRRFLRVELVNNLLAVGVILSSSQQWCVGDGGRGPEHLTYLSANVDSAGPKFELQSSQLLAFVAMPYIPRSVLMMFLRSECSNVTLGLNTEISFRASLVLSYKILSQCVVFQMDVQMVTTSFPRIQMKPFSVDWAHVPPMNQKAIC